MTKRMLIMLAGVVVLIAALALGFFLHIRALMAASPKPGPQTVSTIEATAQEWQPQIAAVGSLVAVRGVDVTTELAGLVRSIQFRSGQDVKAGEVLVQLNDDADRAQLASLQAAAELSAITLKRDQAQLAGQAVSQAVVDADQGDLKSRRALVAQQQAVVDKRAIRAPFAGRVGVTSVNPGQYLNPGDKIVTLQTLDPIYVNFSLPQDRMAGLAVRQVVSVAADAFPEVRFAGRVSAIDAKVDPATRNVLVQATLANADRQLLPGMFARVDLERGAKQQLLTLPQTAITYNPYGSTVFVVQKVQASDATQTAPRQHEKDAKPAPPPLPPGTLVARQVFVTTGETRGDQVAILQGLEAGQQVVTTGQLKLKNDTPVVVDNSVQPGNSPRPTPQEK